ncbi:MAG: hypothetical protein K8F30_04545 [Taibaiella sp.]|nr:hypothetical protein [Taibaiella sp.]
MEALAYNALSSMAVTGLSHALGFAFGKMVRRLTSLHWTFPAKYPRKARQALERGWTVSDIQFTLDFPAQILPAPRGNLATIYYKPDGHYVIRDDVTGEIFQFSDAFDPDWLDEGTENTRPIRPRP